MEVFEILADTTPTKETENEVSFHNDLAKDFTRTVSEKTAKIRTRLCSWWNQKTQHSFGRCLTASLHQQNGSLPHYAWAKCSFNLLFRLFIAYFGATQDVALTWVHRRAYHIPAPVYHEILVYTSPPNYIYIYGMDRGGKHGRNLAFKKPN